MKCTVKKKNMTRRIITEKEYENENCNYKRSQINKIRSMLITISMMMNIKTINMRITTMTKQTINIIFLKIANTIIQLGLNYTL